MVWSGRCEHRCVAPAPNATLTDSIVPRAVDVGRELHGWGAGPKTLVRWLFLQ